MNNENIIWCGSPSQLANLKCYLLCGIFSWLVLPIFVMYWYFLKIKNTNYKITNERLIMRRGVFNKLTDQVELYRVKDIRLHEPFWLRLFGLGNIILITSDKIYGEINLPYIKNPEYLKNNIRDVVEELREKRNVREVDFK